MLKNQQWAGFSAWLSPGRGLRWLVYLCLGLPGWALAAVTLASGSGNFGHVALGASGTPHTLSLTVASATLTDLSAYVGGATGQDFTVSGGSCGPGSTASCTVTVDFTPRQAGLRVGILVVGYNDGSARTLSIPLQGIGDAPVAALNNATQTVLSVTGCTLNSPFQSVEDADGNLYVTNYSADSVCKFPSGGGAGTPVDFSGLSQGLSNPTGLALDARGNLYVSDYSHSRLVRLLTNGTPQVLTLSAGTVNFPTTLSFDGAGNLYVSNYGAGNILKLDAASLAADSSGASANITASVVNTGSITWPSISVPGIAVNSQGTIYVAGRSSNQIIRIPPGGGAGTAVLSVAPFVLNSPMGIAVDAQDNVYVAEENNRRLLQVDRSGGVSQVNIVGTTLPNTVFSLQVRPSGDIVVNDFDGSRLIVLNRQAASQDLGTIAVGATSAPWTTTLFNLGYQRLDFAVPATGNNPALSNLSNGDFALAGAATTCPVTASGAATPGTLAAGSSCTLGITFSPSLGGARSGTLTITDNHQNSAGQTQQISLSGTGNGDTTPDAFSFTPQTGVALGSTVTASPITVSGINVPTPISITGGSYAINGGAYTTTAGTVNNGDTVTLRHTASGSFSTTTSTVLTIGGVQGTFTSQTLAQDTTPNAFSFTPQTGVALSTTITSNTITVSGIHAPTPISVTGGSYAINGGAYTTTAGTVNNGDTVTLRHTASGNLSTFTSTVLTIGSVQGTFTSQTLGQANVSGLPTTAAGVTASLSVTGCSAIASGAHFANPPAGLGPRFPYGLLSFVATGCSGSGVTVNVTYSESLPAGGTVFKCQGSNCTQYPATLGGNTVTYTVTDNGAGDEDAIPGQITDPSGVGYPQDPAAVPTLGAWGGLLLSLLLGGLGLGGRPRPGRPRFRPQ